MNAAPFVFLLGLSFASRLAAPRSTEGPSQDETAIEAAVEPTIDDLAWMSGAWRKENRSSLGEEIWSAPGGGMMLGVNRRFRKGSERGAFEFLRIVQGDGNLIYMASPGGAEATAFPMTEHTHGRVVFENPEHDFPKRISYWLDEEDILHAQVDGGAEDRGPLRFSWERSELLPTD